MWCGAPCTVWHANPGKGWLRIHNWPSEIFSLQFCQAMTLVDPLSSPVMQTSSRWWQFAIRLRQRFPLSLTHWLEFEVLLSGGHTHQHQKLSLWSVLYLMFLSLMLLAGDWASWASVLGHASLQPLFQLVSFAPTTDSLYLCPCHKHNDTMYLCKV